MFTRGLNTRAMTTTELEHASGALWDVARAIYRAGGDATQETVLACYLEHAARLRRAKQERVAA